MRSFILCSAALSTALLLAGCYEKDQDAYLAPPPDYSPDYSYVNLVSDDGRTKRVLVPEACLRAEEPSPADTGPPRIPPGCANNYNLQRMVEQKRDLTKGRPLAPAAGAPAARAAQNYIDGVGQRPLGGGVRDGHAAERAAGTSTEPPPPQ